ncbi:hypothetical protein AB0C07_22440 [Actinoplanes missouriensis]|uniref:hypothetical protein n=1 Tax=Actinoplanes missouriensis TaxID=1866 RepID=UPI0033F85B29
MRTPGRRPGLRSRPEPAGPVRQGPEGAGLLHTVAVVGSPIALASALMFYFGWIRTRAETRALGYDVAVTGMSVQDFVMKSVLVLYVPLLVPVLAALVLAWAHHRLLARAEHQPPLRDSVLWVARFAAVSWPLWLTAYAGMVLLFPGLRWLALPVCLTAALLSTAYADLVRRRLAPRERFAPTVRGLLLVALTLAVFWDVERLAGAVGSAYAARITANPDELAAVTLYSADRLWLQGPDVTETRLGPDDSGYRYRYDGLRLLQYSGGRYFLIGARPDDQHPRVLVVAESPELRWEFSR